MTTLDQLWIACEETAITAGELPPWYALADALEEAR